MQIIMERERAWEQEKKEDDLRRREQDQILEDKRREEDRRRREEDNQRWEGLIKTMLSSAQLKPTEPITSKLRDIPKLPKLQESDDIEAFLYTFERHMETYKVEKVHWVAQIAPLLRGIAQKAYMAVPRELSNDYDEVKEAILRRFDIGEDTYRQRFATVAPQGKESYSQFSARTGDMLDKWARNCLTVKG